MEENAALLRLAQPGAAVFDAIYAQIDKTPTNDGRNGFFLNPNAEWQATIAAVDLLHVNSIFQMVQFGKDKVGFILQSLVIKA